MLIPQQVEHEPVGRQGSGPASLAGVRSQLTGRSAMDKRHRQRLADLARKLQRLRAMGDEFAPVELSEMAKEALSGSAASV